MNRELTEHEINLLSWLLEHGSNKSKKFIKSIPQIHVVGECSCGCASIDFSINGKVPEKEEGLEVVSDYLWTSNLGAENGIFVFLKNNQLAGLEVWSADGIETPGLPNIEQLRSYDAGT